MELTYVNPIYVGAAALGAVMLDNKDVELFDLIATSFVLRGRRRWHCSELVDRLAALKMATDCRDGLKNLCDEGWLTEKPDDIFSLTAEGIRVARSKIGPFTAGGI